MNKFVQFPPVLKVRTAIFEMSFYSLESMISGFLRFRMVSGFLISILVSVLLGCGPTGRDRCYDDCTLRTALCLNTIEEEYTKEWFFCGQDLCLAACDADAAAVSARARERDERDRSAGN